MLMHRLSDRPADTVLLHSHAAVVEACSPLPNIAKQSQEPSQGSPKTHGRVAGLLFVARLSGLRCSVTCKSIGLAPALDRRRHVRALQQYPIKG